MINAIMYYYIYYIYIIYYIHTYTVDYMYMPTRKCLNNIGKQGKFLKRQANVIATISCYSKNI